MIKKFPAASLWFLTIKVSSLRDSQYSVSQTGFIFLTILSLSFAPLGDSQHSPATHSNKFASSIVVSRQLSAGWTGHVINVWFGYPTCFLLHDTLTFGSASATTTCRTAAASASRLCVICICRWQTESHPPTPSTSCTLSSLPLSLPARSFHCHPPEGIVCNVSAAPASSASSNVPCATRALIYWEWNLPKLWLILTNNLLYFLLNIFCVRCQFMHSPSAATSHSAR